MTKGKAGIRALFGKLLIAKVGLRWYVVAVFGYAVVCAGAIGLANLLGDASVVFLSDDLPKFSSPVEMAVSIMMMFIVLSLINGEELAWRGFALPKLQTRYNALTSSVILGVFWGLFHLPLFFTLTGSSQTGANFFGFLLSTVCMSIIFTWMFNHTRGSVLLAYLLHGATNTWTRIFAIDHSGNPLVTGAMTSLTVVIAVILVITLGAENLSRKGTRIQETA
jgi:membrane protease YdiL (CAAX protease family)